MKISVIVPTYKGSKKILNIIQALEQQTVQEFETLVMIDGSPDNTEEILTSYKHTLYSLQIINRPNQGRAKVRNSGAKYANGDLLIFLDDDMRPTPNCIAEHITSYKQWNNTIVVGAQIDDYSKASTDIQKYRCFISRKWAQSLTNLQKQPIPKNQLHLTAANFSIPQSIFWKLEGFDERLNDAEDYDLAVRAFLQNIPIIYNHDAFAWHDDFITCSSYIKRRSEYKEYHTYLKQLKPKLYTKFTERQAQPMSLGKTFLFSLFKNNFWVKSIDQERWIRILPQKVRYRIYDLVIASHFLL